MTRGYVPALVLLGALWGSSYLFIKVAVRDLEPTTMVSLRLLIAFALLLGFLCSRIGRSRALQELRAGWQPIVVLGLGNAAAPYVLIAWGEKHVDSGVAAIANSTVPMFVALLALRFRPSERVSGLRLVGFVVGLGGVGLLAGVHPEGGMWAVLGTLAVVLASVLYAGCVLYAQGSVQEVSGPVLATGSMGVGAIVLLPFGLLQLPSETPGWEALGAVLALAVAGTAVAQIVYFFLIEHHGSARASLVSYVFPVFAVVYGAAILDESLDAVRLCGMALILAGVALGSGLVGARERQAAVR